eukprot:GHVP01060771.1.p1 GENE.GHVP01060771.1~~GHVP01060771.1.p1  ORF type:complete len:410 (+),score=74.82 GHVP01060771.1:749-1978(+)
MPRHSEVTKRQCIEKENVLKNLDILEHEFESLCIIKSLHPYVPKKCKEGDKTFFLVSDITKLKEEPILETLKEKRKTLRKIIKVRKINDPLRLEGLEKTLRKIKRKEQRQIDASIKESYPTFKSVLPTIGDALSFIFLCANIDIDDKIDQTLLDRSSVLSQKFLKLISEKSLLTKGFISIKGIYLEIEIDSVPIFWITPHQFTKELPEYIEPKQVSSLIEFYLRKIHLFIVHLTKTEGKKPKPLNGCVLYFNNEVPSNILKRTAESLGARIETENADSNDITHHIIDRDSIEEMIQNRAYVQPQWIIDCLNKGELLDESLYKMGISLPIHESPFKAQEAFHLAKKKNRTVLINTEGNMIMDSRELNEEMKYGMFALNDDDDLPIEAASMSEKKLKFYRKLKSKDQMNKL